MVATIVKAGERMPLIVLGMPLTMLCEASETTGDISPVLWSAYESTVFCATLDGTEIRIRPGEMHAPLDHALEARSVTTWAYVTAWNPGSRELSSRENDARHERLKEDIVRLGFEAFEGEGQLTHAAWVPERSLLVLGVPASEAVAIGRRYGQNAIVFGQHRREARLLNCRGADTSTNDR